MNARAVTIVIGLVMLAFGVASLLDPGRVMALAGFPILNPSQAAAALGEIRAVYGGVPVVMGLWTIMAGISPRRYRASILFVGLLWLGSPAARLLSAYLDGNPGLPGWVAVAVESIIGLALVACWRGTRQPAAAGAVRGQN